MFSSEKQQRMIVLVIQLTKRKMTEFLFDKQRSNHSMCVQGSGIQQNSFEDWLRQTSAVASSRQQQERGTKVLLITRSR